MGGAPAVGRRVVVTGLAGAGKSTFGRALAERTGLPLVHLDLHYWQPGWVDPTEDEWRSIQRRVLAGDEWIADGNDAETLDLRLERADTLVHLDLPWWLCSARALRRGFTMPGELPPGCDFPRWMRLRDEWKLAARIATKNRSQPEQERRIIAEHGQHVTVHELHSTAEVNAFLAAEPTAA